MRTCVWLYAYGHVHVCAFRNWERTSDVRVLEFQGAGSLWVLRTKLGPLKNAASALIAELFHLPPEN